LLDPGPLVADGLVVATENGASDDIDRLAASGASRQAFLRAAWFAAAAGDAPLASLVARRAGSADAVAALPLALRWVGPLSLREVGGSYWPWRGVPLAASAGESELAALLGSPEAQPVLGRAWRLGPVLADDPAITTLLAAARRAGWIVLTRRLGVCFIVDLAGLRAAAPWPSSKTLRKNRWLERRLAELGDLDFTTVSGAQWTGEIFDLLARIEAESWVGRSADSRDTKFLDEGNRSMWARVVEDPAIAAMLRASILRVGGHPAAFTFGIRTGQRMDFIANSFSERYRENSPGRILLYRELIEAAEAGVDTVGWGAGDPGYKSEMGARPGPDILDLLFVRGRIAAALAAPIWRRGGQ
jgi:CelD/BcsL family acetyltransferase involved in cellulose biosynthesis